jgi:pyruvate,water dikinase
MAVVVQALVPAEASAVVFSRHPVTGDPGTMVVTAIRGLGEPMVSGTVTPDTWTIDKDRRAVTAFQPGDTGERLVLVAGRPTRAPDPGRGASLDEPVLEALVRLVLDVERLYSEPVDVEAAFADGRWTLLQARPITSGR